MPIQPSSSSELLRLSEERFSRAFITSPAALAITNLDEGVIIDVNDAWLRMFAVQRDAAIGATTARIWPTPDGRARIVAELRRLGSVHQQELTLLRYSGEPIDTLYSAVIVNLAGEEVILSTWLDITESKKTRQELAFHASLLDSIHDAIIATDTDSLITAFNQGAEKLYGYTASEVIGKPYVIALGSETSPDQSAVNLAVLAERDELIFESAHHTKDGRRILVEGSTRLRRDAQGEVIGYVTALRDITARRRAEEALRESEARYRTLFEALQEALFIVEIITDDAGHPVDWRYLDVNTQVQRYMGLGYDELVGKTYSQVVAHPDPVWVDLLGQTALTGQPASRELWSPHRQRWLQVAVYSYSPGQAVALFNDITERKQAEQAARRQDEITRAINRVLTEAILSETEEQFCVACLDVAEELTESCFGFIGELHSDGQLYDLALTDPSWDLCADEPSEERKPPGPFPIRGLYGRVVLDGRSLIANEPGAHLDSYGLPPDHPPLTAFLGVPLTDEGRTIGIITVGNRDGGYRPEDQAALEALTPAVVATLNRKRAEAGLRAKETALREYAARLERSNQDLQDFAFTASHDLQEPLRKITFFSDALLSAGARLDERERDYLNRLRSAAGRMSTMIADLLALSRVTTQGHPFEDVDLNQLVADVLSDLEMQVQRTGGAVAFGPLPTLKADPAQMRQLFQNLIGNALKYHRKDAPPRVEISSRAIDANRIQLLVADNGIGFDDAHAGTIFQPFQRLVGRSEYEGTGIGLAICKKIVERHGGQINARSAPGQGTTFIVTLPE